MNTRSEPNLKSILTKRYVVGGDSTKSSHIQLQVGKVYHTLFENCASAASRLFNPPGVSSFACPMNQPVLCRRARTAPPFPDIPLIVMQADSYNPEIMGQLSSLALKGRASSEDEKEAVWSRYALSIIYDQKQESCELRSIISMFDSNTTYVAVFAFPLHVGSVFFDTETNEAVTFGVQVGSEGGSIFACPDLVVRQNIKLQVAGAQSSNTGIILLVDAIQKNEYTGIELIAVYKLSEVPWLLGRINELTHSVIPSPAEVIPSVVSEVLFLNPSATTASTNVGRHGTAVPERNVGNLIQSGAKAFQLYNNDILKNASGRT
jgi:hypothetical protein